MKLQEVVESGTPTTWAVGATGLLLFVAAADSFTGPDITFSLFYVIPVAMAAWGCGRSTAAAFAILSAISWQGVDFGQGRFSPQLVVYAWQFSSRMVFLSAVAALLAALRAALTREREVSRRDHLTGAFNSLAFHDIGDREVLRARRLGRPLTLIFLDVDNFKTVNDTRGHAAGDDLLKTVAHVLTTRTRVTDLVGRIGGDEFAILLPETAAAGAATVAEQLQTQLREVVSAGGWTAVTFSIGVLTTCGTVDSLSSLLGRADGLMYSLKNQTKDGIRYLDDSGALPVGKDSMHSRGGRWRRTTDAS